MDELNNTENMLKIIKWLKESFCKQKQQVDIYLQYVIELEKDIVTKNDLIDKLSNENKDLKSEMTKYKERIKEVNSQMSKDNFDLNNEKLLTENTFSIVQIPNYLDNIRSHFERIVLRDWDKDLCAFSNYINSIIKDSNLEFNIPDVFENEIEAKEIIEKARKLISDFFNLLRINNINFELIIPLNNDNFEESLHVKIQDDRNQNPMQIDYCCFPGITTISIDKKSNSEKSKKVQYKARIMSIQSKIK